MAARRAISRKAWRDSRFSARSLANFPFPDAWAAILVASLIGIGSYLVVSAIERLVMPWHVSMRSGAER